MKPTRRQIAHYLIGTAALVFLIASIVAIDPLPAYGEGSFQHAANRTVTPTYDVWMLFPMTLLVTGILLAGITLYTWVGKTEVQNIKRTLSRVLSYLLFGGFLLMPPAYIVFGFLSNRPWIGTKTVTVTKTVHYGILPEIGPLLVLWLLVLVVAFGMPYMPRP